MPLSSEPGPSHEMSRHRKLLVGAAVAGVLILIGGILF